MADIIQQRRDTAARWSQYNPILLEGEVGYVTDNPNQYKIGNGRDRWNDLPFRGYTGTITQDTGDDENAVMSQKATTAKLTELGSYGSDDAYIRAYTDKNNKFLFGILKDGSIEWAKGVPTPIRKYIEFLDINSINQSVAQLVSEVSSLNNIHYFKSNPEWILAVVDANDRILMGIKSDGSCYVPNREMFHVENNLEWLKLIIDKNGKIIFGIKGDGSCYIAKGVSEDAKKEIESLNKRLDLVSDDTKLTNKLLYKVLNQPCGCSMDEYGKEIPSNIAVYNVIRKATQVVTLKWYALSEIPSVGGYYEKGEHIGLPYTSCMENDRFVGFDVSIHTFMTCVNNPYSLIYTESLRDNISQYGFTYHSGRSTIAGWMGMVCNIHVENAIGMSIPHDTGAWKYLESIGRIVKLADQSAQGVRIGDMRWEAGHGTLIQDVWRDNYGRVTKIRTSENGGFSTDWTPEDFNTYLKEHSCILYRYVDLFENVKYEPSIYNPIGDEPIQNVTYNNDICTFGGDRIAYREGYIMFLNYNLKEVKDWTSIEVYKDDVLFGTYSIDSNVHRFDLTPLNLGYGKYKARCVNGSSYSDFTYWEVIETNVQYQSIDNKTKRVTFSSKNGKPLFVRFHRLNGGPKAIYELTEDDMKKGYADIDAAELIKLQYNNISVDGATYCKVYFQGDYGRVTNEPILTDLK